MLPKSTKNERCHKTLPQSTAAMPSSIADPSLERTFRGHKETVTSVAFSPSMKQLVSGSSDCHLMLWSFKPQLRAFRFVGHKGPINHVEYSPSGHLIASASADRTVRLWLPSAKGESVSIKGHTAGVRSVSFSGDCKHIISASDDKTVKVSDAAPE